MPGIVGFTKGAIKDTDARGVLQKMQDIITHQDFYIKDELFCDEHVCATRSHIHVVQKHPQPYHDRGMYVWLDGEFYNHKEIGYNWSIIANTDPELLLKLYRNNKDFSFLKYIDGFYSAVIYDPLAQKLHLIIDRYGFRHLYWTIQNGSLVWTSEVKAVLKFPNFKPKIDQQAVKEFFGIGYLLEDRTWFEGVELVPSGTVLTWDIREETFTKQRYWWWDEIKPINGKIDEDLIAEELGRLFIDSVELRSQSREGEHVGLFLSGGLDSRAILSAIPDRDYPIHAVTFGKEGCHDLRIAAMAVKVKKANHHVIKLNKDNWLGPRIAGVWWTDGQKDLMHMHGIEARNLMRGLFDINLNGFAGDLILGGSYLKGKESFDVCINKELASSQMHCNPILLDNFDNYSGLKKTDFYFLQNRVRRFTFGGTKHSLVTMEHRKSFFDNKLIEFAYSLPDRLRFRHYVYNLMLLKSFPSFYKRIPWQSTNFPISYPLLLVRVLCRLKRERDKLLRKMERFGFKFSDPRDYVDYTDWIRQEPARLFFSEVLRNPKALYGEYISKDQVNRDLDSHLKGEDRSENLCRYLTFEIWLQQVFSRKYRNYDS